MAITENYTPGYSRNASQFMANRRAETHAAFFLPYLRPGFNVLDCGCGPGTITAGLALAVAPGRVVGIDLGESQIALAMAHAAEQGLGNTEFKVGNIYELPFDEGAFDAVFAHAVFEHLSDPLKALREVRRVLKPGGMVGVCSPDWGGFLISPAPPALEEAITFYKQLQAQNGGNPNIGRELGLLLREAGFTRINLTASYECYENRQAIAEYLALRIEAVPTLDTGKSGGVDNSQISRMAAALRSWSNHPASLFAQAWVAAVGWND